MITVEQVKEVCQEIGNQGGVWHQQSIKADGTDYRENFTGATMRQVYAAHALQGIIASEGPDIPTPPVVAAKRAVKYADALIAELRK